MREGLSCPQRKWPRERGHFYAAQWLVSSRSGGRAIGAVATVDDHDATISITTLTPMPTVIVAADHGDTFARTIFADAHGHATIAGADPQILRGGRRNSHQRCGGRGGGDGEKNGFHDSLQG